MPEDYDELFKTGMFKAPPDFADHVMAEVARQPLPDLASLPRRVRECIQWLTLIGAALLGAFQLATFMFGIWSITSAG